MQISESAASQQSSLQEHVSWIINLQRVHLVRFVTTKVKVPRKYYDNFPKTNIVILFLTVLLLILMRLTQVADQDPVFVLLLFLLAVSSSAQTQLLHVVPEQSAGEPLEHPWTSCGGLRLTEELGEARGSGRRRGSVARTLVISSGVHGCVKAPERC